MLKHGDEDGLPLLPMAPAELLALMQDENWPFVARRVNHKASFTTTSIKGAGFKDPPRPATLNLAGQVRSHGA